MWMPTGSIIARGASLLRPPTTRDTIPMPSVVSATPGATIDGDASPRSPRASHDAFVLAEDEASAPEVARRGESVLSASLVALGTSSRRSGARGRAAGGAGRGNERQAGRAAVGARRGDDSADGGRWAEGGEGTSCGRDEWQAGGRTSSGRSGFRGRAAGGTSGGRDERQAGGGTSSGRSGAR